MNNVLILYPDTFLCYSKFARKVSRILKNLSSFCLTTKKDHNGFIKKIITEKYKNIEIHEVNDFLSSEITHAIIFDDGEEFNKESNEIAALSIPIRQIKIKITRVINIKEEKEYSNLKSTSTYEYIGRNSDWGNPYSIIEGDGRDEVIRKYEYDFERGYINEIDKIYPLSGKRLGCFCKPAKCHGDILAKFLNSWDDGK